MASYSELKARGLNLDMSRGKPGADQLDLSSDIINILEPGDYKSEDGFDCRNYGGIDGIPEMKRLFAELMDVLPEEVLVGGNASLTLMYECVIAFALSGQIRNHTGATFAKRKFLCPAPGYDRHFAITEYLGIEMITIPMTSDGPDMDEIRKHVADPAVAGIWCVPVFSNPQGVVYSDAVIKELAALKPAAPDFRILWDNAYIVHSFEGAPPKIANLLRECEKKGSPDMPLMFTSFSKITHPGAGVCAMAASRANLEAMRKHLIVQTIGPDKINQLRHVRYFTDAAGVYSHMEKHATILRQKFNIVLNELEARLGENGDTSRRQNGDTDEHICRSQYGTWLIPKGGYFISFDTKPKHAKKTVQLCKEAGLIMTPAGATFPYGHDPEDKNIRIAPTFPSIDQLKPAMELFCAAVKAANSATGG